MARYEDGGQPGTWCAVEAVAHDPGAVVLRGADEGGAEWSCTGSVSDEGIVVDLSPLGGPAALQGTLTVRLDR